MSAADRREHGLAPRPLIASLYDVEGARSRSARGGDRVRGGRGHGRGPGRRRAGGAASDVDRRRPPLLPLCRPMPRSGASGPSSPPTTRCAKHGGTMSRSGSSITRDTPRNLDRMIRSIQASLDYYTRQFGPYPYSHLSVVEHPGQRHGDARRGQHAHVHGRDSPSGIRRTIREPRSPVRGRGARDGAPVDGPVRTRRGSPGPVREPRLVLRDEGRGARHGGSSSFGGF